MNDFKNNDYQENDDNAFIIGKGFEIDNEGDEYYTDEEDEKMQRKGLFKSLTFTISIIVLSVAFAF